MRSIPLIVLTGLLVGCSLPGFEKIPAKTPPQNERQNFLQAVENLTDEGPLTGLERYVRQTTDPSLRRAAQLVLQQLERQRDCATELAEAQQAVIELDNLKQDNLQLTENKEQLTEQIEQLTEQIEQLKVLLIELEKRPR